jgi:oligopeptide transport system substrate-binding protein
VRKLQTKIMTHSSPIAILALCLGVSIITSGCAASANNSGFFGKTDPPRENVLRYVSGSEPASLDPQVSAGQNEARIYMALYEGLIEYDPKTSAPVPAIAERWEVNKDFSEITFHLRRNARFSNGDPISAGDFVYTVRRGLAPAFASTNAALAYYIKYAQAYNEGAVFVLDPASQQFLLEKDFAAGGEQPVTTGTNPPAKIPGLSLSSQPVESVAAEYPPIPEDKVPDADTPFHRFMHSPTRVVLPGDEKGRNMALDANPKLKAAVAGKQFVPVKAEDVGVEAVDDYTFRISLQQQAPFFISLMPHQFFRAIHRKTVEGFRDTWTDPRHIVTSGSFKLESWEHYDRIVVTRDPMNWDAGRAKLDRIVFYMLQDPTTMINLYKAGEIDATYNHTVPTPWRGVIGPMKDFMDAPEAAIEYYRFNTLQGPTKDVRVRKALNMSLNKEAIGKWRNVRPSTTLIPEGIFPGYPQPKGDPFDPDKAKRLLVEAGYGDASGNFDAEKFAASEIELITNPDGSNTAYAEFMQAQWRQALGVTIQIRVMENKTYFATVAKLNYKGISRFGWGADYMDPFTFLGLFYTPTGNNGTGWWDPKFVELLDEANRTIDHQKRYAILAQAEKLLLDAQPILPIAVGTTRFMKKPYVKGLYPNATTLIPWKWVYIERDQAKWDYGIPSMAE